MLPGDGGDDSLVRFPALRRRSAKDLRLAEMIEALTKAEREGRLAEKIRLYARASLLIVDEIG